MTIQDESLYPSEPLESLDEDYEKAVLHLAWNFDKSSLRRTLLFAWVELLPKEIPPPVDDYDPKGGRALGGASNHRIFIRHAVVSARQGIEWYRSCFENRAVLPENDGTVSSEGRGKQLVLDDLDEVPAWPTLISIIEEQEKHFPFLPEWIQCPRVHHLVPRMEFEPGALWSREAERETAREWLLSQLHFDIWKFPEYWGSIHLVAPNPLYRKLESRSQPGEARLIQFQPRAGKSLEGITLLIRNQDPWGMTGGNAITVRSPLLRLARAGDVSTIEVWDQRRGALEPAATRQTLRQIATEVSFSHQLVVKTPAETIEVSRRGEPQRAVVGEPRRTNMARARLLEGRVTRGKQARGVALGQRWFRGEKKKAREVLRQLLNEATETVLIIDPYFGEIELYDFALATGRYDIPIWILSSASVLKESHLDNKGLIRGERLMHAVDTLSSEKKMNPFVVRVMPGARPAIHDRFLCIDNRIWMLGSSLNEFGSRGAMLLALPDPEGVRGDLLAAWNQAVPLESWLSERDETRAAEQGKERET